MYWGSVEGRPAEEEGISSSQLDEGEENSIRQPPKAYKWRVNLCPPQWIEPDWYLSTCEAAVLNRKAKKKEGENLLAHV